MLILADNIGQSGGEFRLGWSVGYVDAEYKEFIGATGEDVADERVFQNTPEWTATGVLTYSTPADLFNTPGLVSVITSLAYRSETSQFEIPTPELDQDSYTLWDLSLVWTADSGRWSAGLHGKNLTDEEYKVAGYNFPALGQEGNVTAFYGPPQTVTATVEYVF